MAEPPKKRKQNVACDPCKFRRVKCDLAELLESLAGPSSGDASLADLVRANPDVRCRHCENKGVKCTTENIVNPTRPKKGGRRIDEAKKLFGGETNSDGESASLSQAEQPGLAGLDEVEGVNAEAGPSTWDDPAFDFIHGFEPPAADPQADPRHPHKLGDLMPASAVHLLDPTWEEDFSASGQFNFLLPPPAEPTTVVPSQALPNTASTSHSTLLPPHLPSSTSVRSLRTSQHASPSTQTSGSSRTSPPSDGMDSTADGVLRRALNVPGHAAAAIWDEMANQRKSNGPSPYTSTDHRSMSRSSQDATDLAGHTPYSISTSSRYTPDVDFHAVYSAFVPRQPEPQGSFYDLPASIPRPTSSNEEEISPFTSARTPTRSSLTASGRKRARTEREEDDADPWRIWSEEQDSAMVRWSRRELVQEQLADRALGGEMSRHLVKTYFHCVHPSFPALSPEGFYLEWHRAGQKSDQMTPARETLCAVMEAWGSRYSDSPVVLNLPHEKRALAPKVIMPDGTLQPGTQARIHWGRARLSVCNALVDRARQLIDANGLLRRPTITGLQALILYNQLLHLTDQRGRAEDQFMENQMVHATIIEQLKLLNLMWESQGLPPVEKGDLPVSLGQTRMKQRRIFWTIIVSDSFNACATGDLPKIPQEEMDAVAEWLAAVEAKLPSSTFRALTFFMGCYHRLSTTARHIAYAISHPNKRPGRVVVHEFCAAIRAVWAQVKAIAKDIVLTTAELLKDCQDRLLGFSPLNYVSNLRMSCPFLLLITHQCIREQLEFRRTLRGSYIYVEESDSSTSPPGLEDNNIALLEQLHSQSVDILLHTCRSQVEMYQRLLPTGMVQTAAIFLRVLIATAQFLAEVPTVEQGYTDSTLGGYGWTWETKQREVQICVQALHQLGWAWGDVGDVLETVMLSMERTQPTTEQLALYQPSPKSVAAEERLGAVVAMERADEKSVLDGAMSFWPPDSIPRLIESAMQELSLTDTPPTRPLDSQGVPFEDLRQIREESNAVTQRPRANVRFSSSVFDSVPFGNGQTDPSEALANKLGAMNHSVADISETAQIPFSREGMAENAKRRAVERNAAVPTAPPSAPPPRTRVFEPTSTTVAAEAWFASLVSDWQEPQSQMEQPDSVPMAAAAPSSFDSIDMNNPFENPSQFFGDTEGQDASWLGWNPSAPAQTDGGIQPPSNSVEQDLAELEKLLSGFVDQSDRRGA